MDLFNNLLLGFSVALTPMNIMLALVGCLVGTLIGVLPGIGPVATVAMLLPLTFYMEPVTGLIMLAAIFYGAQYGGSTTAILVNLPGESSAVVTCLDGHQMARNGRAGAALAIAAVGSFFAGTVATILISVASPPLSEVAMKFGAPEYFALMILGLVAAVVLASGSLIKAISMILLGLLLGLVGTDGNSGGTRFTFGLNVLADGIDFVPLAVGMFGLGEIIANLARTADARSVVAGKIESLWPTREEIRLSTPAVLRGTALGSVLGILPGGGATLSAFAAYALEKKLSKHPQRFGKGTPEGVAAPESANNAGAQTSFIPMLTLGIPGNAVMALMVGAMMIHGIQPGPAVMTEKPQLFWGLIVSMWIGNLMLLVINLPMIGLWIQLLRVPYRLLYLAIIVFCLIGVYSIKNNTFDVLVAGFFGAVGWLFIRLKCEPAPLLLGFVLGPLMEENLRRAMRISGGDPMIFINRPISLGLLIAAVLLVAVVALPAIRSTREEAFQEE